MNNKILDFSEYMIRSQGDKALAQELFDIFLEDFHAKRKLLEEAFSTKNSDKVRKLSHALRGSAGNISAHALYAVLVKLEDMGKKDDLTNIDTLRAELDVQFNALMARIATLKEELR